MSFLIRFDQISLSFGDQVILREADFKIELGERVCLIGRNGAGKSTLLKLITNTIEPDDGKIDRPGALRFSVLDQNLAEGTTESVRQFVSGGMSEQLDRIQRYEALVGHADPRADRLRDAEALDRQIISAGGWSVDAQIDSILSQLDLPPEKSMSALSGGWRRRVALARALVCQPELLLLDEPTNHLDINTITWLENEVQQFPGAVLFVTHDRSFVDRVATRIVDIDRGKLKNWPGGYRDYLRQKRKADSDEDQHNREFDKKLAEEEVWIRQGIKARETRNEGRVRTLELLREQRAQRIKRSRTARIHINESGDLSGRKVIELRNVTHGYDGKDLLKDFSLRVMRGERIGIIGNNGIGKSTLLRILLGELEPNSGSVKLGTQLQIGYFDQLRRELDTTRSVAELVGEGRDYIMLNGHKKHVIAYLTDFLFTAKRARTRIAALSGGERNRVILAKLFTEAANLLVLDEPTNDLDVETLEALEQRLRDYRGTLIVVSHDRHFLDAVVTSTLVFEAGGTVTRYAGGYSDWARGKRDLAVGDELARPQKDAPTDNKPKQKSGKLPYKLQRELGQLPMVIASLEERLASLQEEIVDPDFYKQTHEKTKSRLQALANCEAELATVTDRWIELEDLVTAGSGTI